MNDIDRILDQIRAAPLPNGFETLDSAILRALAAKPTTGAAARPIGMAALAALVVGIVGGLPGGNAPAAAAATIGSPSPLAPSSLLAGDR